MPTRVRLDAETESLVNRLAKKTGRTKCQVIRDAIERFAAAADRPMPTRSAYDACAHVIGIADSGGANLSEHTGQKFLALLALLAARARARRRR